MHLVDVDATKRTVGQLKASRLPTLLPVPLPLSRSSRAEAKCSSCEKGPGLVRPGLLLYGHSYKKLQTEVATL
jgi:hypothetical protein